jgi:signal transduction histidine kinase
MNASAGSAGQLYEPNVSVSTKRVNDKVEIRVEDNGNGIPQNIVDKIFQPFLQPSRQARDRPGVVISL